MKTLTIIAAQNIRTERDLVMGDVIAEIRTEHPLLTVFQMLQLGQATVQAAASAADIPHVIHTPHVTNAPAPPADEPQETSGPPHPAAGRGAGGEGPDAQPSIVQPPPSDASIVLARPLTDFPLLEPKHREHLAAANPPITTLHDAVDYLERNGGHFRDLAGIGTATDKQIKSALGL